MASASVALTDALIDNLKAATSGHRFWCKYLKDLSVSGPNPFSVHLAVLLQPYLRFILDGSKTVESRFSKKRIAPFNSVSQGDVVLLKKAAAKGISGVCLVTQVWFYQLDTETWYEIRDSFTRALRAEDPEFWEQRKSAQFATLMRVSEVHSLPLIEISKRDRRGWVVLHSHKPIAPYLL